MGQSNGAHHWSWPTLRMLFSLWGRQWGWTWSVETSTEAQPLMIMLHNWFYCIDCDIRCTFYQGVWPHSHLNSKTQSFDSLTRLILRNWRAIRSNSFGLNFHDKKLNSWSSKSPKSPILYEMVILPGSPWVDLDFQGFIVLNKMFSEMS